MKKILLSLLALVGLSQASTNIQQQRFKTISEITEDTQLMLEHTKDFQLANEKIEIAYHYSHSSHQSHSSHESHYSHYSSR
ncbi:MAG: hypothetical protein QG567_1366 [Campylobacterota bacterium]|nr:hypothetical protein [Campylobacterota bacterium]